MSGLGRRLAGAAITEYVPELDHSELSALVMVRLICLLLGEPLATHHS